MNRATETALAKSVQSMRALAGGEWDNFMRLLVARADEITDSLVTADSANLHRIQGAAQEARNLLNTLAKAPKLADELYEKEKLTNANRPQHPTS